MLHTSHMALLESRGLDLEVLTKLGWKSVERGKPGEDWIAIPYYRGDKLVNTKYRTISGVKKFSQEEGGEQCFYNLNCLEGIENPTEIYICEGEIDAVTAYQFGILALSVPNGAPAAPIDGGEDGKYSYLKEIKDRYTDTIFVLAVDSDAAGGNLLHDLTRILGPHRCKWVKYPKGCKDLNESLVKYGAGVIPKIRATADWIAIDGIFRMSQLPPPPNTVPLPVHVDGLEESLLARPGDVIVVTGLPGGGKTTLVNEIMCNMATHHGWRTCVGSFEQDPRADHLRYLMTYRAQKPYHLIPTGGETYNAAMQWIDDNFVFVTQNQLKDGVYDLGWFLNLAAAAVVRYGCKMVIIDPWNELEHIKNRQQTITDYVGQSIKEIRRFAKKYMVAFVIVAHPAKMERNREGVYPIPSLYDISDCYSADTEVLTHRGWLLHSDITCDDLVMTFDPETENLAWQHPSRVVEHLYAGEMINFKGYGYDLLVSPNHRMLVTPAWKEPQGTQIETGIGRPVKRKKDSWQFVRASEIGGSPMLIPKAGNALDGADPDHIVIYNKVFNAEAFVEFVGLWIAHGCHQSSGLSLSQVVGHKANHVEDLLNVCGIKFKRKERADRRGYQSVVTWYIGVKNNPEIVKWIKDKAGRISSNQRIPYPIFTMSKRLKMAFLNGYSTELFPRPKSINGIRVSTASRLLFDDLQRLAVECGVPVSGNVRPPRKSNYSAEFQINFGTPQRKVVSLRGRNTTKVKNYEGMIYCLTVPTGAYVVRRNGKVAISGNSAHWFNKPDLGVVVHRGDGDMTNVRIAKVRYQGLIGKRGDTLLKYDDYRGVYVKPTQDELEAHYGILNEKKTTFTRPSKKKKQVENQDELI